MGSKSKEIQSKSIVSKTDGRVVQKFTIKLTGTKSQVSKPIRGPNGSMVRFRSGEEPEAEVVTSEHVDAKSQKIDGRHGG